MNLLAMPPIAATDEQLWLASRAGDRDAFGQLVERYQSLIAAVTYSRTGNLAQAADLAQETFVAAWRQATELREPGRLRAWLCGIARTLAANAARREARRGGPATPIEAIREPIAPDDDPEAQAVSREEEALLWRALETLPASYREPLVLYYREERSIAEVATQLELSSDAVKQRLSRGRALLRDEMATLVESALGRSRPTRAFTAAVLAAIAGVVPGSAQAAMLAVSAYAEATTPALETAADTAGGGDPVATGGALAASAAGAGKKLLAGTGGAAVAGPAVGLSIAWLASRLAGATARSPAEGAVIRRSFRLAIAFVLPMIVVLLALVWVGIGPQAGSPWFLAVAASGWTLALLGGIFWISHRQTAAIARIRRQTGTDDDDYTATLAARGLTPPGPRRWATRTRLFGLPLVAFASGGLDVGGYRSRGARGWIAIGDVAISPLLAIGGLAIAPVAIGGATCGLLSLSVLGLAVGAVAFGSLAFGLVAIGLVAVGWLGAAGPVAIAAHHAVGAQALAAEANTAIARQWFADQWFTPIVGIFGAATPLLILLAIVVPLALLARHAWRLRRTRPRA